MQSDSLQDARAICADGTYFPNNLRIMSQLIKFTFSFLFLLDPFLTADLHFMYNKLSEAEYRHCVKTIVNIANFIHTIRNKEFSFQCPPACIHSCRGYVPTISRQFTHARTRSGVD